LNRIQCTSISHVHGQPIDFPILDLRMKLGKLFGTILVIFVSSSRGDYGDGPGVGVNGEGPWVQLYPNPVKHDAGSQDVGKFTSDSNLNGEAGFQPGCGEPTNYCHRTADINSTLAHGAQGIQLVPEIQIASVSCELFTDTDCTMPLKSNPTVGDGITSFNGSFVFSLICYAGCKPKQAGPLFGDPVPDEYYSVPYPTMSVDPVFK
jgi:hypothetical protein